MRVGIVTLLGNNYGGTLQAYALKEQLEKMGIDVTHINYQLSENKISIKRIIKTFIYYKRNKKFKKFKKEYFKLTKKTKNIKELKKQSSNYDVFIAGSDQIWNQKIPIEDRGVFFLDFAGNQKKIVYAASIGRDIINEEEKGQISKWLNNLDYISIREKTGVNLYSKLTNKEIENVLDPALLLSDKEWDKIINKKIITNEKYIFSYTLGANKSVLDSIEKISKKLNMKIIEISYKKNFENEIKNINDAGPSEFVELIKNSDYVLTNSFHGTVFAILNKKQFFVFTRGNMNSRIYDLLDILKLKDRIIDNGSIENIDLEERINYDEVYEILEKEREKSIKFLKQALGIQ